MSLYLRRAPPEAIQIHDCPPAQADVVSADDYVTVFVRGASGEIEPRPARWGMPTPGRARRARAVSRAYRERLRLTDEEFERYVADEPDPGVPFIDPSALTWRPHLEPRGRCLVPFSALGLRQGASAPVASDDYLRPTRSPAYLGGVIETGWEGVRSSERGRETLDLFGLATVERVVQADLPRRRYTPIVLTDPAEITLWLDAPWSKARLLRRPSANVVSP